MDATRMDVLKVVVKETAIEVPLQPTLRIREGGRSSKRDGRHGEWKLYNDDTD